MSEIQLKRLREKKILTAIMAVMVAISGFCAYKIITIVSEYRQAEEEYKSISDQAIKKAETIEIEDHTKDKYLIVDHAKLKSMNSEYVGWINIPDTTVSYPVVKTTDNKKYLSRSFEGNWSGSGTIFMDYYNKPDWNDFHTIIYGHHMNNKTMFWTLNQYRKSDFWNSHPTVEIYHDGNVYVYTTFSFYKAQVDDDSYWLTYSGDQDKSDWLGWIKSSSMYTSDLDVRINDHIITLSTCVDADGPDRWVLHAVLTETISLTD